MMSVLPPAKNLVAPQGLVSAVGNSVLLQVLLSVGNSVVVHHPVKGNMDLDCMYNHSGVIGQSGKLLCLPTGVHLCCCPAQKSICNQMPELWSS